MRKILLAVLMVAFLAMPAFASVQNIKISGEIDSTYLYRESFDLGDTSTSPADGDELQSLFITQTTLQVDADLTDNVAATVAIINERAWGEQSSNTVGTDIDLQLAYVTLREMLYSPLTVVVGRQEFSYGNSLIVSSAGHSCNDSGINGVATDLSKQTAMDAVRFILDYSPLTIEILYAKIDANGVTGASQTAANKDDIDLYGLNATYELGDEMDSVVEAYLFSKKDQTGKDATLGSKADHIKVIGLRGSTNPIEGLNIQLEYAHQGGTSSVGTIVNQTRDAHAVQFITNYQIPALEDYNPVVSYSFTKLTGNGKSTSTGTDEYTAWDPMFEDQNGGTIYNTLFSLSDLIIHSTSLTVNPMEDVTAKLSYTKLWKEKDYDATSLSLDQVDGTSETVTTISGKNGLGQELDLDLSYDYTEDVQFGASLGLFLPGDLFKSSDNAKQMLVSMDVKF